MRWKTASKKDNMTSIPRNWIYIHYYEALNALFRIENSLRVFVYLVLKNQLLEEWADINIVSDDSEKGTINSIASKRINQARDFGYLGYTINCPVMYLTSGELIRLITDDNYWKYFKTYFPAKRDIIKHKLDEIGVIRNSLAHFRPMKSEDVELLKQNATHVLTSVEECLNELGRCYNVVPTNTQEQWYKALSNLGTELCNLRLEQCNSEQWVTLKMTYTSRIISTTQYSDIYHEHTILNFVTPSILTNYPNLTKYITCLIEATMRSEKYTPDNINFSKVISLFFSRDVLKENYEIIKKDIESLLSTITQETDLIQNDNLARGKLISITRVYASLQREKDSNPTWTVNTYSASNPVTDETPPEYWGNTWLLSSMVTSIHHYPWMPVSVSDIDLFVQPIPLFNIPSV